jgi:magnesium-transporting ATPase (P-type)
MTSKSSKSYHLFLVLAILNLLTFYLFAGKSVLDIHKTDKGFWDDQIFNYYISVSFLMLLIWFSYWTFRRKLTSRKLTWLHLLITFITVFILPEITIRYFNPMPRRYLDYKDGLKPLHFYGSMTATFWIVGIILLTSEVLLITNIRQKPKKTTLFGSDI